MKKIRYEKPANTWGEAFPAGNGHMGIMVCSGMETDKIDFSHNTFFSGEKSLHNNQEGADKVFYKMREELLEEDFEKALKTSADFIGIRQNYGTNLPVGTLKIDYSIDSAHIEHYERELDIQKGVIKTAYEYRKNPVFRTAFVSHPHKVMIYKVAMDKKEGDSLCMDLTFQGNNDHFKTKVCDQGICFEAKAREELHSDGKTGVNLYGAMLVQTDGKLKSEEKQNSIIITEASEVTVFVAMETDFYCEEPKDCLKENLMIHLEDCKKAGYETIWEYHQKDIRKFMDRVSLVIEDDFIPFLFQYGRYLLLSSSREDSKLPAHLQGIWNDNVACRIGWTCDMHLDINTQMNYWPSEVTNLTEVNVPLFQWIEKELVPSGKITAEKSYGLKGWVAELVSNSWGFTAPYWASPISPCPTGGVWILTHMWEHYLVTEDKEFLRHHGYKVIKEAVEFFADYVFKEEKTGYFIGGPSISPENTFAVEGKEYQISNGCTYEIVLIRELFSIFLKASKILEIEDEMVRKVGDLKEKLLPFQILKDGKLAEWLHNYPAADSQHRHTSHLLGLFPFSQITPEKTPELAKAAKISLEEKLKDTERWEDTGWARSLLILYAARLKDGEMAYHHIHSMLSHLLTDNFMVIHPPTRGAAAFDNVYELDGNTGLTSAIAEMLMQSHDDMIELLPALPEKWKNGSFQGLVARGGIEVSLRWEKSKLTTAEFLSGESRSCKIKYKEQIKEISLIGGKAEKFLYRKE